MSVSKSAFQRDSIKARLKQSLTFLINLRASKAADNNLYTGKEGESYVRFNVQSSKEAKKTKYLQVSRVAMSLFRTRVDE